MPPQGGCRVPSSHSQEMLAKIQATYPERIDPEIFEWTLGSSVRTLNGGYDSLEHRAGGASHLPLALL